MGRDKEGEPELEDIVHEGAGGVLCVEADGPTPGVGCAGRGIIAAFEKLDELDAFGVYKPDVVLFDEDTLAEEKGSTVIACCLESAMAASYRLLAKAVLEECEA